ncbi:MAG: PadR family transcriptional regulator [Salaquimonas sp.]
MNAKTLILAILNFQESTGYEIRKNCTDGAFSYFGDISYGSIYPTLAKLEVELLVTSRMEQDPGKPERKIYSLTELGRGEFIKALAHPPAKDKFKSEFLLIAMTAETNTPEAVKHAIDLRIADIEAELAMIKEHTTDCDHAGTCWVGEYGISIKQFDLEYLKKKRGELQAIAGTALTMKSAAE